MPTYEYLCTACANEWETEQSIRDEPLKACPKCRKRTARRQISRGTGFILKGSGWYSDLYSSAKSPSSSDASTSGSDASKADAARSEKSGTSKADAAKTDTSKTDTKSTPTATTSGRKGSSAAA